MKIKICKFVIGLFLISLCFVFALDKFSVVFSQNGESVKTIPTNELSPQVPCVSPVEKAGGRKTYLVGASKLSSEDQKRIAGKYGPLMIPKGENKLAKNIRKAALRRDAEQISNLQNALKTWLKAHPNAKAEEIKETSSHYQAIINRIKDNTEAKQRAALPQWDWRDRLNVGPVMYQGDNCNACWAFAAIDAVAASFMKAVQDELNYNYHTPLEDGEIHTGIGPSHRFLEGARPSIQELLNCMPIPAENICQLGWHGKAFNFFVNEKGVPIEPQGIQFKKLDENGNVTRIPWLSYQKGVKSKCSPVLGFKKAYSWDYVNYPPDKLPTVEQLKLALVKHGPIAAPMVFDNCLVAYKGGVFNEKSNGDVGHVVLLIGWDDKKGEKGAWLIKNSWGEGWGEKGFGWIEYGSNNFGQFAAWIDANPKEGWEMFSP